MSSNGTMKKLLNKDLKDAEHQQLRKFVCAPEGVSFEQMLEPGFWGNVSADLKPWTIITCRANDGSWYAELLVTSVGRQWARVHVLLNVPLSSADVERSQTGSHDVKHVDGQGWAVIRRADRATVYADGETREDAEKWLVDHLKQIALA